MKLKDWIVKEGIDIKRFAYENGITERSLHYWMKGQFTPLPIHQQLIHKISKGLVTYKDWSKNGQKTTDKRVRSTKADGVHITEHLATDKVAKPKSGKGER